MATKMSYADQLKHPNWQRKRLEALEAAKFQCKACYGTETTLHVHHKRYFKGRMAWEYDIAELAVLCEDCHKLEHESDEIRNRIFSRLDVDGPLSVDDFMAYGCGAMADWMAGDELLALFEVIEESKPLQFWSGRVARDLHNHLWVGPTGAHQIAQLLEKQEFCTEMADLLKKHGVELMRWDF